MSVCPACSQEGTPFKNSKNSKYLMVFSKPYISERGNGWKDSKSGLDVLRKELSKVGLDLAEFRLSWLWLHEPGKNEECYTVGRDLVLEEAKGKKAVILIGSEATEEFCGLSASNTAGLQVDAPALSAPIVFVLPKPEGVFVKGAGVGELRLACQKLGRILDSE